MKLTAPLALFLALATAGAGAEVAPLARVPAGEYAPVLRGKDDVARVPVAAFLLETRPVTNAEFLAFVQANPRWRRGAVSPLFADQEYLAHWAGPLDLGAAAPAESPVVRVSWFAARAYAAWAGRRLPTTAEWERAAATGARENDEEATRVWQRAQLAWFAARETSPLPDVGRDTPNAYGLHNLHTLVWEWVDDFSTAMTTGESRADTGLERDLFCGAGAAGARDPRDYPAFMRAGFRSSLRANYTVPNLGFRCARDLASP